MCIIVGGIETLAFVVESFLSPTAEEVEMINP